jgi:AcrR family transcriptional regulator
MEEVGLGEAYYEHSQAQDVGQFLGNSTFFPTFPPVAKRADAERNRDKILAAAQAAFADPNADVSMAEISRRADVGMATLYRNFPGRRELLEALYAQRIGALCEAAKTAAGETPGAVLITWLHQFFAFITSKRAIAAELLERSDGTNPLLGAGRSRVLAAGRPLLEAAQRAHRIRDDLTLEQITDMIVAIARIHGDSLYVEPILQAAFDGLRCARETSTESAVIHALPLNG